MTHLLTIFLAFSAQQTPDEKAQEEAAKKRIQEFQKEIAKAKDPDARADCIDKLAQIQHPKILNELINWLTKGDDECMKAAAENTAKYSKDKKAAEALLAAAKAHNRKPDLIRKMLYEIGNCRYKGVVKGLVPFYRHQEIEVAKEAVDAAGALKTKDAIQPLLDLARELEAIRDDQTPGGNAPPPPGGLPGPNTPGPANSADDKQKRKREVLPAAMSALKTITGEKHETVKEWQQWWDKNRKTFKDQE